MRRRIAKHAKKMAKRRAQLRQTHYRFPITKGYFKLRKNADKSKT